MVVARMEVAATVVTAVVVVLEVAGVVAVAAAVVVVAMAELWTFLTTIAASASELLPLHTPTLACQVAPGLSMPGLWKHLPAAAAMEVDRVEEAIMVVVVLLLEVVLEVVLEVGVGVGVEVEAKVGVVVEVGVQAMVVVKVLLSARRIKERRQLDSISPQARLRM
jgi:hypothetical protein